ncbi:protein transport protein Sec24C [Prorops nasuta]|uniref:protein transport protein Sec24C n=1 Tax=Prorops nasuta TaxID=863751 RepID=UPI0034CE4ACA
MNPQYIHQQQQPPYSGTQNMPPYGELNSNVPPNSQAYSSQPLLPGPPQNNMPPIQSQYAVNHSEGNISHTTPPTGIPPTNQNTILNKMANMSLGNQQRPLMQPFGAPPLGKNYPAVSTPSNVNGFNSPTDNLPQEGNLGHPSSGLSTVGPLQSGLHSSRPPLSGSPLSSPPTSGPSTSESLLSGPSLSGLPTLGPPLPGPPSFVPQQSRSTLSGAPPSGPPTTGHDTQHITTPSTINQQNFSTTQSSSLPYPGQPTGAVTQTKLPQHYPGYISAHKSNEFPQSNQQHSNQAFGLYDASPKPPLMSQPSHLGQRTTNFTPAHTQPNSLSGPPLSSQQNLSGPPLPSQQNLSGPSLPSQQNLSGPPLPGQQNLSGPPLPGQQNLSGPPLPGQQNLSGPPLPGQQNLSGPLLSSQQSLSGPLSSQANLSAQTSQAQQNFNNTLLQQQTFKGPPSTGQSNFSGPQTLNQPNLSGPPLQGQQYPPTSSQQKLPGHHYSVSAGATSPGQQNFPGPPLPREQNFSAPPLPGQALPGQKQYMPSASMPGPGQTASPLGYNHQAPPGISSYPPQPSAYQQQGYQNQGDMYGGQRPYQSGMPASSGGYQQPGLQPQQARRLDPDQMPSPIQVMEDDQRNRGGVFITNQKGLLPPLVTTKIVVQDQGNASPRYIRATFYTVPTTADIIKQTSVPFGLIISPMARTVEGEFEPPIVDMGEIGPVRCVRCKAYMSPFMQFIDAGRRFQCMFCKATTEVPAEYFQHLDHTGQRMDRYERPELMLGTYEFIATTDYCRNNTLPNPPAIVFVIDVSYNNVKSGLVNLICMRMKSIIRNLPIDAGQTKTKMRVGFITYNNTVHFYNINPLLAQPQMMVVGDVQEVFMPLLDGFLCDAEESETVIDSLMSQIPTMFADTRETEVILAPAIQAGLEALKASGCPGKLLVFHSSLPIAEAPGKLKNRDDRKVLGTEKEKAVLAPQNNIYNTLAQECVGAGCSVDLFVFNNSYVDLATIGQVSRLTGGEVYKYTYFQADIDGERLITDVINNISRPIGFDAVMRVRTSTGVRATDFFGHFFMSNTTDMEIAGIDCNKAVAIEIKHDDKLTEDEGVYIQAALLYTSCGGIRRLRIINLSLKTSSQMAELYRACDLDAIINFFAKQSVFKLIESTPKAIKDSLIARCANILAAYRKHCASASSVSQLILPECMKLMPLYINCLLKSDAISGGADMTIDDRTYAMMAVATMPLSISVVYIYPRLLPLHYVESKDTELPQMLRCSMDKLSDDGAYLLENSIHMFLWLGLSLSPQWVQEVFGVPSVHQINTDQPSLPVLDTPLNKKMHEIINRVRSERHRCMRLTLVRQKDKIEMVLRHFLIEDRGNDNNLSYVDFLCHMHKEIRIILSP